MEERKKNHMLISLHDHFRFIQIELASSVLMSILIIDPAARSNNSSYMPCLDFCDKNAKEKQPSGNSIPDFYGKPK